MPDMITFPYKSLLMRDAHDLTKKAGFTNLSDMLADAHAHYEAYCEYKAMGMIMVTCPPNDTSTLKAVELDATADYMEVDSIDLEADAEDIAAMQKLTGEDDIRAFFTRLLVMYEQIVDARSKGHHLGMLQAQGSNGPIIAWLHVITEDAPVVTGNGYNHKPLLN